MKRFILLFTAALFLLPVASQSAPKNKKKDSHVVVAVPEVEAKVIAIETEGVQWLLNVDKFGVLRCYHFGKKISDPAQFRDFTCYRTRHGVEKYGDAAMAYPTVGGRYNNEPALHVKYANGDHNTELYYTGHTVSEKDGVVTTEISLKDYVSLLEVTLVFEAWQKENVIISHSEIKNAGKKSVELLEYASSFMPVRAEKYLLTHFWGHWGYEMNVEHELLGHDRKVIETRIGVSATKLNNPSFMLSLDTEEFSERNGEVIAGALAWSGNFKLCFDRNINCLNISAGINPFASAYKLAAGETFVTPNMIWTWSGNGAGQASRNLHAWARKDGVYGGGSVNPTLLNSWEGAYFNFNAATLIGMIDDAADMGLEMFVLDDGWFGNGEYARNDDKAGLGDWELNTAKLPEGIDYIASHAHDKGLKFGIWIEPEMVNPKSNLANNHPDWVVRSAGREIYTGRNQWLLDLSNPAVQDFVYGVFDRTMQLSDKIDYIKWDCNRVVNSFGSDWQADQDRFFVEYVQGYYKVLRRIREKYPKTIIQCCSSGGSRVDYGQLAFHNEVWASDNTDAVSRSNIQYGTSLIYPASIMGSHVSIVPNHQTKSTTPLKFRFDMACTGRLGMELQPKDLNAEERAFADQCIKAYKQYRDLVFNGDLYRLVAPEEGRYSLMYVSPDKRRAVVFIFKLDYESREIHRTLKLEGLAPGLRYKVNELNAKKSSWWGNDDSWTGDFLMNGGFNPHFYHKYDSAVFYLEAE